MAVNHCVECYSAGNFTVAVRELDGDLLCKLHFEKAGGVWVEEDAAPEKPTAPPARKFKAPEPEKEIEAMAKKCACGCGETLVANSLWKYKRGHKQHDHKPLQGKGGRSEPEGAGGKAEFISVPVSEAVLDVLWGRLTLAEKARLLFPQTTEA